MAASGGKDRKQAVYSACESCTAKWFSKRELESCPRCGSNLVLHMLERPPWRRLDNPESGEMTVDNTEIVPATLSGPEKPGPTHVGPK